MEAAVFESLSVEAIPDYIKTNRSVSKWSRIKELEYFIKCSYSTPGTDSSRNLRLKKIDGCGTYTLSLDIILRSLVQFYLISSFEQEVKAMAQSIVNQVHASVKENKDITDKKDIIDSLMKWCKSSSGTEDYLKYIRDKRSEILKTWVQMLSLKPYSILFTSLAKFTPVWKKNTSHFQSSSFGIQASIFGITG
jgi:hypothetical protein